MWGQLWLLFYINYRQIIIISRQFVHLGHSYPSHRSQRRGAVFGIRANRTGQGRSLRFRKKKNTDFLEYNTDLYKESKSIVPLFLFFNFFFLKSCHCFAPDLRFKPTNGTKKTRTCNRKTNLFCRRHLTSCNTKMETQRRNKLSFIYIRNQWHTVHQKGKSTVKKKKRLQIAEGETWNPTEQRLRNRRLNASRHR